MSHHSSRCSGSSRSHRSLSSRDRSQDSNLDSSIQEAEQPSHQSSRGSPSWNLSMLASVASSRLASGGASGQAAPPIHQSRVPRSHRTDSQGQNQSIHRRLASSFQLNEQRNSRRSRQEGAGISSARPRRQNISERMPIWASRWVSGSHCKECGPTVTLSTRETLLSHMREIHTGIVLECSEMRCGQVFTSRGSKAKHVKLHERDSRHAVKCELCSARFKTRSELWSHRVNAHGKYSDRNES